MLRGCLIFVSNPESTILRVRALKEEGERRI
jgi:hypothetical protein